MKLNLINTPSDIEDGLSILAESLHLELSTDGVLVKVSKKTDGIGLKFNHGTWALAYNTKAGFARALSLLKQFQGKEEGFVYEEQAKLDTLGVMIDCSRNAVPTIEALKKMLTKLALMGYNTAQLYTEDLFEIEKYPYFGYLRGRYTVKALNEIDAFAEKIGIEMVPCIQTLAHLLHPLKWREFEDVLDCNDILLCGEEKTYELIEAMFATMSKAFKSRKINIGMDEAHMLGLGKYLDKNGYQNRFEIMLKHLARVVEIARKYEYEPMMWSDMFFRLANEGEYYATGRPIKQEIIDKVPKDIALVYWDYYSEKEETYRAMMKSHNDFKRKIVFAGGAWKWVGFTPQNQISMKIAKDATNACFTSEIKDVLITCWGDNGAEASMFSVLPTLSYWAETCWANDEEIWRKKRFEICCDISYDNFMVLDTPAFTPNNLAPGDIGANPTKYYFYQDVMLGMVDATMPDHSYEAHFAKCAYNLEKVARCNADWAIIFHSQARLCKVLEIKVTLGVKLRNAYKAGDKETLGELANIIIPQLVERLDSFQETYQEQWMAENKPFGIDNFDIRTGGLKQRILTAQKRIQAYLNGEIAIIEEFEEEILPFELPVFGKPLCSVHWEKVATPSSLFWM